jgi:hypothetical protein
MSSTDNINYVNASGASTNSTYVTPALTQTTWYKVKVKSGSSCSSFSAAVKFTVLPGGGWTGATSTDWNTAGNWCSNTVPGSTTDVIISNTSANINMPTINAGTAASARNLTINNTYPASVVTIATSGSASLSVFGDFTNNGGFTDNSTAATAGVIMAGSALQKIAGLTPGVFNNLTVNNSASAPAVEVSTNNLVVNSNLTLTSGEVNLNGYTLTLGTSAASTGTLTRSSGSWLYGGSFQRWYPTSAIVQGSGASLFPIGDVANYRPIYFGSSGLTSSGGTIKVSHTSISGASAVSFPDAGTPVQVRSNSYWSVSTGNGMSSTGTPFSIRTEGTGMGLVWSTTDLRATLAAAAASGVAATNAGTPTNPQVNRSALSVANLSNSFYWGSTNATQTTLPISPASPGSSDGQQLQDQDRGFILFPNPSDGRSITIRNNIPSDNAYALTIFDNMGRVIARSNSVQAGATLHFTPALPGGVYYARLSSTTVSGIQRFLVIK